MKTTIIHYALAAAAVLMLAFAGLAVAATPSATAPAAEVTGETSQPMSGAPTMMGSMGMHGQGGMMGMAMHGRATGAEAPWVSLALRYAQELGLSAEQVRQLEALRTGFEKQAVRQSADIRVAELELRELLEADPVELSKVEAKLRQAAALETDLRMARIRALEQGKAVLSAEQRGKLKQRVSETGMGGHGATMGGAGMEQMHEFMQSGRMPGAMAGMMEMATRMGDGDPMAGMVRMMEMMGGMGGKMGSGGGMGGMMGPGTGMPTPESTR
jgi:hypothetical protein